MAVISKLSVAITANTKAFIGGLKGAASKLGGFVKGAISKIGQFAKFLAVGFLAATAALIFFTRRAAKGIDVIAKLSKQLGFSTENLAAYGLAAELAGVDNATFNKSLQKFNRTLGEAKLGTGEGATAFKQLGLSMRDVEKLSPDAALNLVANRLAGVEDKAIQAALASDLFGRSGVKLLPLLSNGAKGLAQFRAEADRLGISINKVDSQKVEDSLDALTIVGKSITGIFNKLAVEFAPIVTAIAEQVTNAFVFMRQKALPVFIGFVKSTLKAALTFLKTAIPIFVNFSKLIIDVFFGVVDVISDVFNFIFGIFSDFLGDTEKTGEAAETMSTKIQKTINFLRLVFKNLGAIVRTISSQIIASIAFALKKVIGFIKKIPLIGKAFKGIEKFFDVDSEEFFKGLEKAANANVDEGIEKIGDRIAKAQKKITKENENLAKGVTKFIQPLINLLDNIPDIKIPGFKAPGETPAAMAAATQNRELKAVSATSVEAFKILNRNRKGDADKIVDAVEDGNQKLGVIADVVTTFQMILGQEVALQVGI